MNKNLKERNMSKEEYKAGCKNSRSNVRKAKVQYEVRLTVASKNKKKYVYRYVRSNRKETIDLLYRENGEMVKEEDEKVELLNSHFASVFLS